MPSDPIIHPQHYCRTIASAELREAAERTSSALARAMNDQIMTILQPPRDIPPMTVCQVPTEALTLDSLRQAMEFLRRIGPRPSAIRVRPDRAPVELVRYSLTDRLAYIKAATANAHGVCVDILADHKRTFLCMGVVKHCDEMPNWDTKAMAKGKRYPCATP